MLCEEKEGVTLRERMEEVLCEVLCNVWIEKVSGK